MSIFLLFFLFFINDTDELLENSISSEILLRRALFEETGGMYPELITRNDIKVFLPPIGGLTVYICAILSPLLFTSFFQVLFKSRQSCFISDASKELTLRVHDECRCLFSLTGVDDLFIYLFCPDTGRFFVRIFVLQTVPYICHGRMYKNCSER